MIITGVVMCGESRFVRVSEDSQVKRYRVEANVLPYFSRQPKPGAVWTHQVGTAPALEDWDSIESRNQYESNIYGFRGPAAEFPYVTS